ncbi:MAG: hypothetical protein R3F43_17720 [bacterium]
MARIEAEDADALAAPARLKDNPKLKTAARKALWGRRKEAALRFLFPRRGTAPTLGRY